MQSSTGRRTVLFAGLAAGLMLAGFVGAWMMLNAATSRAGGLAKVFAEKAGDEDRLRAVKNVLTQTKDDRERLSGHLVEQGGIVSFIERVEALGKTAGVSVTVDEISLEPFEGAPTLEHLVVRFHASGSWQQVSHLLELVESLPLPIRFSEVRFETSGGNTPVWRGTFAIVALASSD
jgi:Tfp pilus assembly protein PilO